jgi:hypothetical protein
VLVMLTMFVCVGVVFPFDRIDVIVTPVFGGVFVLMLGCRIGVSVVFVF